MLHTFMSGHSKWSQIKRKKGIKDVQKGQIFTKMSKLITLAVKEGGSVTDPDKNFRLRLAVERAKGENMPKEAIARAVEKAAGGGHENLHAAIYEGFGPGGITLVIAATTDNPNRSHSEVKNTLEKAGGKIGGQHSVLYLFDKCGVVVFKKGEGVEVKVFDFADKIGALDIEEAPEDFVVYIPFENLGHVSQNLTDIEPATVDVFYRPKAPISVSTEVADKAHALIESLAALDDVERVYSNFELL